MRRNVPVTPAGSIDIVAQPIDSPVDIYLLPGDEVLEEKLPTVEEIFSTRLGKSGGIYACIIT